VAGSAARPAAKQFRGVFRRARTRLL